MNWLKNLTIFLPIPDLLDPDQLASDKAGSTVFSTQIYHHFPVSGSMLEFYFHKVDAFGLVLKDSDTESENLSSLIRLSVSDDQRTYSSKDVSFIGIW